MQSGTISPGEQSQASNAAAPPLQSSCKHHFSSNYYRNLKLQTAIYQWKFKTINFLEFLCDDQLTGCENGRPIMTDPVSGQTVCSCQYDSARLALSGYSARLPSAGVSVYGTPYPSTDQNPYPSIGVDSSAFYSPLVCNLFAFNLWLLCFQMLYCFGAGQFDGVVPRINRVMCAFAIQCNKNKQRQPQWARVRCFAYVIDRHSDGPRRMR